MVVAKYLLPENESPRKKHHEEMVKRLISSPRSRGVANTYIYRCDTEDRERIVGILNQWDKESYSTKPTGQVINKEAVADIKEWCSNSSGKDLAVVKKFLQHLTNEQVKNNEDDNGFDTQRSGSGTNRSNSGFRKPSFNRGNSLPLSNRPGFSRSESLTNGSFYEGRGNRSGMFHVVHGPPQPEYQKRPATSSTAAKASKPAQKMERQSTQPAMRKSEYFEISANRSSMFGEVIPPPPQQHENRPSTKQYERQQSPKQFENRPPTTQQQQQQQQRPQTNQSVRSRPNTYARPSTNQSSMGKWERSGTIALARPSSKIPVGGRNRSAAQNRRRPPTQGSQRSTDSSQKFKYSANLHDNNEEIQENTVYERQPTAMSYKEYHNIDTMHDNSFYGQQKHEEVHFNKGEWVSTRRAPARRWQPSQIF